MLKSFSIIALSLLALVTGKSKCHSDKTGNTGHINTNNCYKGKLVIKGICLHYVVSVAEGSLDTSKMAASWTDPSTGRVYRNVFTISNPCSFPDSIQEGDTFYFSLTPDAADNCMRCQAYREVPAVQNPIAVKKEGCQ